MATMDNTRKEFGAKVQYFRELRGWSQEELGVRIGKTGSNVSRIESGKQNCSVADIKMIALALEVSVAQLFGEDASPGLDDRDDVSRVWQQAAACAQVARDARHVLTVALNQFESFNYCLAQKN